MTPKLPGSLQAARLLFFLDAVIWTGISLATLLRAQNASPPTQMWYWLFAILMLGNAGMMLWVGILLARQAPWVFWLAVALLAANILLTVTDEFGTYDLLTMLLGLVILGLLALNRKAFITMR